MSGFSVCLRLVSQEFRQQSKSPHKVPIIKRAPAAMQRAQTIVGLYGYSTGFDISERDYGCEHVHGSDHDRDYGRDHDDGHGQPVQPLRMD